LTDFVRVSSLLANVYHRAYIQPANPAASAMRILEAVVAIWLLANLLLGLYLIVPWERD